MKGILAIAAVLLVILLAWGLQGSATPSSTPTEEVATPAAPIRSEPPRRTDAPATDAAVDDVPEPARTAEPEPTETVRFTGIVRAPDGTPVPRARIGIARPEPKEQYLYGFHLAETDAEGRFDATWKGALRPRTAIVASHDDYPPTHLFVEDLAQRTDLELVFRDGITFSGTAYDESGAPLAGLRLDVMTHTSQVLPGWSPDFVPRAPPGCPD